MKKIVILLSILVLLFSCDFLLQDDQDSAGISGVISIDGNPVEGVRVLAQELMPDGNVKSVGERTLVAEGLYMTTTNSDGNYYLGLPPGAYTVEASMENTLGAVESGVIVQSRAVTEVNITLTATGSIEGLIQETTDSLEVPGAIIAIKGTSYVAVSDDFGNYTISNVPIGSYFITVMHDDYWKDTLGPISVSAGNTTNTGTSTSLTPSWISDSVAPSGTLSFVHNQGNPNLDFNAQVAVDGLMYNVGEYNTLFPGDPIEFDEELDGYNSIAVTHMGNGDLFIAYVKPDGTEYDGRYKVWDESAQNFSYSGVFLDDTAIDDDTRPKHIALATLGNGNVVLAYSFKDNGDTNWYGAYRVWNGSSFGSEESFLTGNANESSSAIGTEVIPMSTNDYVIAYMHEDIEEGSYQYFTSGTSGGEIDFYIDIADYCVDFSTAPLSATEFVVVYSIYPASGSRPISYRICTSSGAGSIVEFDSYSDMDIDQISTGALSGTQFVTTYAMGEAIDNKEGWYMVRDLGNTKFSGEAHDSTLSTLSSGNFVITYQNSAEEVGYSVFSSTGSLVYDFTVIDDNLPQFTLTEKNIGLSTAGMNNGYFVIAYMNFLDKGVFVVKNENHGVIFNKTSDNEVTLYNNTKDTLEMYISAVQ